jgi:heterotetrameric sarcosine oxidase gamma subunit
MAEPLRFPPPPLGGPARRGPLGERAAAAVAACPGLRVEELPFPGQILVQGDGGAPTLQDAFADALGIRAPTSGGGVAHGDGVDVLCIAADRWLVVTAGGREEVLRRRLRQALEGLEAAVTDVTDARAVFHLTGPLAAEVLAKGGTVGLGAWPVAPGGWCGEGRLGGVEVLVQGLGEVVEPLAEGGNGGFRLYVPVSLARHFAAWLRAAVEEH